MIYVMKPVFLYLATLSRYSTDYQVQANIELATVEQSNPAPAYRPLGRAWRTKSGKYWFRDNICCGDGSKITTINTHVATVTYDENTVCRYQRFTLRTKQLIMNENGVAVNG